MLYSFSYFSCFLLVPLVFFVFVFLTFSAVASIYRKLNQAKKHRTAVLVLVWSWLFSGLYGSRSVGPHHCFIVLWHKLLFHVPLSETSAHQRLLLSLGCLLNYTEYKCILNMCWNFIFPKEMKSPMCCCHLCCLLHITQRTSLHCSNRK